jgi:transcription elongation factor SPT5
VSSDGPDDVSHVGGFASSELAVQDLEDEARRVTARGPDTRSSITTIENLVLPFRVPRDTDPSVWSVRVKVGVLLSTCTVLTNDGQLGQEADIVLQICRRCLEPRESQPPAITSAFARSSIPGYVFIEAYDVGEVRHAVDGFVTVRDKQPHFIASTEYVGLLSRDTLSSSRVEVGQWVRCLVGRYRNDLGYVFETDEWDANVVFVPRIPEPRGKRQRGGRPPPRTWTAAEVVQRYGSTRVQVQGPNKIVSGRSVYEDGLVMVWVPMSHLRVSNYSPGNIVPFVRSTILRTDDLFGACVKRFAQDSTQVGDRILVVSGEHAGIIGRVERIHDNVADVVTQSPEEHSELVIRIVLRDLMPHFLAGDHVKDRWSDRVGIVVAVDNDDKKLTFLSKETNEEVSLSHHLPPSLTISGPVDRYINPRRTIL